MRLPVPSRSFLASVVLLAVVVASVGAWSAWRTRQELGRQLEARGLALAGAVEVASRGAIRGNALVEEMIAQRLLDNARLVDRLLLAWPADPGLLGTIATANGLRRIDLLDRDGRPYAPPPPAPPRPHPGARGPGMGTGPLRRDMGGPGMAMGHAVDPERAARHRQMMPYTWGPRWRRSTPPAPGPDDGPPAIRDRRFWQGSVFGVAVAARSFPGIIAVHADAGYVLNFRQEIGVDRQLEELGRQPGVTTIALLDPDLTVLTHSDPARIGSRDDDPFLRQALADRHERTRVTTGAPGGPAGGEGLEIVRPLALGDGRAGLLRITLSTEPIRQAWRRDLRAALALGLGVLLVGGLGMAAIFHLQSRHLAEVRALEVAMERRERLAALGNLAAVVSHEVRNPLNAIGMGLQRLRAEFPPADGADEHARMLDLMTGEVRRLDRIVEEVLTLARPRPLATVTGPVRPLIEDVVALVEPEARARGVAVTLDAPPDLPPARWDPDQVRQVLQNLLRNGLDALPRGGTLAVTAAAAAGALRLAVTDSGEGIPADVLPRIFEPYVSTRRGGLGLGLSIARRIVEAHGGRITAESRPGQGARFTVTLPLDGPPEAPGDAAGG